MSLVAVPQPTTAGMPSSRAMMAAWQVRPPRFVTIAEARFITGSQSGSVMSATSTSPALHARHFLRVLDDSRMARADPLADAASGGQHLGARFQRIAQYRAPGAALHRLRTRLQDVDLSVAAILAPLDVHGSAVMFLDDERLLRKLGDVRLAQAKSDGGRHAATSTVRTRCLEPGSA